MNNPSPPPHPDSPSAFSPSPRQPRGRARLWIITGLTLLLAVAIFAALSGWRYLRHNGSAPPERPPVAVSAMQITPTEVPSSIAAVGSLRAVREVSLTPETAGRVVDIRFKQGQQVEAGSLLVQLYDAAERADRAAALARAELAEAQLARSRTLIDSGAESRETVDQRSAEHNQALAAVKQLDARIEQKQIRAPFSGRLGIRRIDLGQYLNPGEPIVTLTDTNQLFVDFSVPQQNLRWLQPGRAVRVTTDAWPGREFAATVDTIDPQVSTDTRNISIRASLPNPEHALQPGMFVNAELQLPAQSGQLVVPSTAIQTSAAGANVVVIRGPEASTQGQAEFVPVTIGRRLGDWDVVSEGLSDGDVVIVEGQLRVQPGAAVQVANLKSAGEL